MNGPQHYLAAEILLEEVREMLKRDIDDQNVARGILSAANRGIAAASVHAQLAQVAAMLEKVDHHGRYDREWSTALERQKGE